MFEQVDLDEAAGRKWDVIVAGTSFAAMFFSKALPAGLDVLFIEKGAIQPHQDQLARGTRYIEEIDQENTSGHKKGWVAHTLFGGNSNCWWGQTPRLHPNDFRLRSLYGIGEDWPLSYDDLEPHYLEAEQVMEIAGGGNEHVLPRSAPFPYPPHALTLAETEFARARPDIWFPAPAARANGGSRNTCCANGVCDLCPIDAKFTILNGLSAFERPGARLLTKAEVRSVRIEGNRARGVAVRTGFGRTTELRAEVIALATNALFNAAILLRSDLGNAALGRYINEQTAREFFVDIPIENYYGGTSVTAHCYGLYDGVHRRDNGAVLVESYNSPPKLRPEPGKWTHRLHLKCIAEDLPLAENRVILTGAGEPRILWTGHSEYGRKGLDFALRNLATILPVEIEALYHYRQGETEAHIQGTHRMGTDPATSVVDTRLRSHAAPNLFVLCAGAFPSCSPANPTLTLAALSLLAGGTLK